MRTQTKLIFPTFLLLCNLGAACVAFRNRDPRRGVYWLASAICIAMVAYE